MSAKQRPGPLLLAAALATFAVAVGCEGAAAPGNADRYPLVDATSGATPTGYETDPSPTCERALATFHDGTKPARRPIVIPPAPGLRATAVSEHMTRLEWSFGDLQGDCRPVELLISVDATARGTPTTDSIAVTGGRGTVELAHADFLPAPDVARASAYSADGHRSRTVSVFIRRGPDVPPDPPEPTPPPTAPAGEPVSCSGRPTAVDDPPSDVLTHEPGSGPSPVVDMTPALAGIDVTHATFQLDDRTICAAFVFAKPPPKKVELTLTLRDTSVSSCCVALRFRRTAGGLEVGHLTTDVNGRYRLELVPNAGASIRDSTLRLSGTLPDPSMWQMQTRRMPAADDIAWGVSTRYAADKYGPYYGDWLPEYAPTVEPVIRHRDGKTVVPGSG